MRATAALIATALAALAPFSMQAAAQVAALPAPVLLDGFEDLGPWTPNASDGVRAAIEPVAGDSGQAMALDWDFGRVSGYAFARRMLPIDWPAHYELALRVRGTGGVNDLQIKFTDADAANVWWVQKPNFRATGEWQTIRIRPRDVTFAWGPTQDRTLRRTQAMEIVVVRGRDGGAGRLEVDGLAMRRLPPPMPPAPPVASAPAVLDGDPATGWDARGGDVLDLDFRGRREIGGLVLDWSQGGGAARYAIEAQDADGGWRVVRQVTAGNGGRDPLALPGLETARLRLRLPEDAPAARLVAVEVKAPEWADTPNAFVANLAREAPRGAFPRGFSGEQPYWTLAGSDGGAESGLIGEDGAIEVAKGGFSIEPYVIVDGRRFGWAQVTASVSMPDGHLPAPAASWAGPGFTLESALLSDMTAPRLLARWRLTNSGDAPKRFSLLLGIRPFQVNAPAQFLSQQGGVSEISQVRWADGALAVTRPPAITGDPPVVQSVRPLVAPAFVGMAPFDAGLLARPEALPAATLLDDPTGLGSAALGWDVTLAPGETFELPLVVPHGDGADQIDAGGFEQARAATLDWWRVRLGGVTLQVPAGRQNVADTLKSALAQVLMSREGPVLKPGTRSYDRSWIRDGAMMGDTLLRLGVVDPVADFADWYGPYLFDNGKVPCCVDWRGADPVPENDSHGQYIHLVTQLWRYTGDRDRLARQWGSLDAARRYMEGLRQSERTVENREPGRRMLYGLMPPSISHEGYAAKAQYSLWDDFWALTGYKDAADAAVALGRPEAAEIARQRDEFQADIHAAIGEAVRHWDIDFIPGATSLGDFDATSTTMALDPAGEQARLDPALLARTFEKQWERVSGRDAVGAEWEDYTPYELRNISAFVRLGWRARAMGLLDFYMDDRRPHAWNGWAEVVGRDAREVRFIGDMPHAWVASDFIRAALDLFAYERQDDHAVVLAAGLTPDWLAGEGSAIRGVHTAYGTVDMHIRADKRRLTLDLGGTARPPGGFVLPWPFDDAPGRATVNGRPARFGADGLRIGADGGPVRVIVER